MPLIEVAPKKETNSNIVDSTKAVSSPAPVVSTDKAPLINKVSQTSVPETVSPEKPGEATDVQKGLKPFMNYEVQTGEKETFVKGTRPRFGDEGQSHDLFGSFNVPNTPTAKPEEKTVPEHVNGLLNPKVNPTIGESTKAILNETKQQALTPKPENVTKPIADSAEVIGFKVILRDAIKFGASDVHLAVGFSPTVRINGQLKSLNYPLLTKKALDMYVQEVLSVRKDSDNLANNFTDLDVGYDFESRRFRINISKQGETYSMVMRIVPDRVPTIEELGLPAILNDLSGISSGLILVTGPIGSGKTTTLSTIINNINNKYSKNIITLEDPIEYVFPKSLSIVRQREFGTDFVSWPEALKSLMRQDPDVVLVGESNDLETISSTLGLAEAGHLVFTSLNTSSAVQSIARMIDVFPGDKQGQVKTQLSSVLTAIITQRLVPLEGGGRKAVHEILIATSAVKSAIRDGNIHLIDNIIQTGHSLGMISLEKSLSELVKTQQISIETAKIFANKPAEIQTFINN